MALETKTFVVTGATSGIGLAVADELTARGASVLGVGRSAERCSLMQEQLRAQAAPHAQVEYLVADLALQSDVRALALRIGERLQAWDKPWLDGLINNAASVPFWQTLTAEGFDEQWAVNHLAPFLLTMQLLPHLQAAPMARIVTVSSGTHRGARIDWQDVQLLHSYSPIKAYGRSKLGNILFTVEFNRRFAGHSHMRAFAADPGLVNTGIGLKSNSFVARWAWSIRRRGGVEPAQAAQGIVFLASEPSIQDSPEPYWRNARPKMPSAQARNLQSARQLWELSAQMSGCSN